MSESEYVYHEKAEIETMTEVFRTLIFDNPGYVTTDMINKYTDTLKELKLKMKNEMQINAPDLIPNLEQQIKKCQCNTDTGKIYHWSQLFSDFVMEFSENFYWRKLGLITITLEIILKNAEEMMEKAHEFRYPSLRITYLHSLKVKMFNILISKFVNNENIKKFIK